MSEEIKFEKALERLEKIVEDLESGNISLEEALKKYEEGVKLSRSCQKKLDEAEKKIEVLTRSLDGSFKKEKFDLDENAGEDTKTVATAKKSRKQSARETSDEDKDLLI